MMIEQMFEWVFEAMVQRLDGADGQFVGSDQVSAETGLVSSDGAVASDAEEIPAGLASWEPGLFLAGVLSSLDRTRLSGADLVEVLRAEERLIAHFQAVQAKTMAELAHADPADPDSWVRSEIEWEVASDEIGAALRLTRRGAETRLAAAVQMWEEFPAVGEALARGDFDFYRGRVICDGVAGLPSDVAGPIVDTVLDRAGGLTSGQLRAWIRRLVAQADPETAKGRYEQAVEERAVVAHVNDDGTADLCGYDLPPDRVAEARDRIERIARSLHTADETRTLDQLRADVYLDLLCGTAHEQRARGVVDVTIDVDTLAGLADHPAEIPGFGPVISDIARQLALEYGRTWQITLTHRGQPVWTGTTRRRPDTALARRVRSLHPRCVFPGCRMPSRNCDLDHRRRWTDGGATSEHNLAPLCRHHHRLRDKGWTYQLLADGTHHWTSPLGR